MAGTSRSPPGPSERKPNTGRIGVLDGVRGVAILLVIIFYGSNTLPAALHATAFEAVAHEGGHLGVDIFFVLSGYLITSLLLDEYKRTVFLAVVGALALGGAFHISLLGWLLGAFYLTDYAFGNTAVWLVHTWSLLIEEQFYLFWPALIMLLGISRAKNIAFALIPGVAVRASGDVRPLAESPRIDRCHGVLDRELLPDRTPLLQAVPYRACRFRAGRFAGQDRAGGIGFGKALAGYSRSVR